MIRFVGVGGVVIETARWVNQRARKRIAPSLGYLWVLCRKGQVQAFSGRVRSPLPD